jgi:hypothetical protein
VASASRPRQRLSLTERTTGPQRAGEPDHELQVLRDQQEGAKRDEEAKDVDRQGRAKRDSPAQAEVDEGLGQAPLAAQEEGADQQPATIVTAATQSARCPATRLTP